MPPMDVGALKDLLDPIELGSLADRKDDLQFDTVLSLGERQRLVIARLLYWKPAIAIL